MMSSTMIASGIGGLAVVVGLAVVLMFVRVSARAGLVAAAVLGALLTIDWRLAASGALHRWHAVPPPMAIVVGLGMIAAATGALLPVGRRVLNVVPLALVVGFQGFRLPLELVMHQAAVEGVMPVQMSYSGWNFDILSGITAIAVAVLIASGRAPRALILGWNLLGSVLLVAIIVIAVAATPTFAVFGDAHLNTWVADPPFVWLPGILVPAALFGHLLVWRKILES